MSRYKPVGWRGEPHRHSLAARGVSTKYGHTYFTQKNHRGCPHQAGSMCRDCRRYGIHESPEDLFGSVKSGKDLKQEESAVLRGVGKGKILEKKGDMFLFEHEDGGRGWFEKRQFVDDSKTMGDLFDARKQKTSKTRRKLQKVAYDEPKEIEGAGGLINGVANFGTKVIQITTFRPVEFGVRTGKGERRG